MTFLDWCVGEVWVSGDEREKERDRKVEKREEKENSNEDVIEERDSKEV